MRRRCCCGECLASFTIASVGVNTYAFTDTSVGSHTRAWTSEDGGTSAANPWTHTFPTDRMYWVELAITLQDGTTCKVRQYVGDLLLCNACQPALVGETVYVTIPSAPAGSLVLCDNIRNNVPGIWAIDNTIPTPSNCVWGPTSYLLGSCFRCRSPLGDFGTHFLRGLVSIGTIGFPTTSVQIDAELSVGPGSISTDCGAAATGGVATYRKTTPVGAGGFDCRGSHTLTKISETPSLHYIAWPNTVSVLIPG